MPITIVQYQNEKELRAANPDVKNFTVVHRSDEEQTIEDEIRALRAKNISGRVYQVGDVYWKESHYSLQGTLQTP